MLTRDARVTSLMLNTPLKQARFSMLSGHFWSRFFGARKSVGHEHVRKCTWSGLLLTLTAHNAWLADRAEFQRHCAFSGAPEKVAPKALAIPHGRASKHVSCAHPRITYELGRSSRKSLVPETGPIRHHPSPNVSIRGRINFWSPFWPRTFRHP